MVKCPKCGVINRINAEFCRECGVRLKPKSIIKPMEKLSLLGSDGHRTILKDGSVSKMNPSKLKNYEFQFQKVTGSTIRNKITYYIEETRIIQRYYIGSTKGKDEEILIFYLPYEEILKVHLFLGKENLIRISSLSGCIYLFTKDNETAVNFVDMIEVVSARRGHSIELNIEFLMEFKPGGGMGILFGF